MPLLPLALLPHNQLHGRVFESEASSGGSPLGGMYGYHVREGAPYIDVPTTPTERPQHRHTSDGRVTEDYTSVGEALSKHHGGHNGGG